MLNTSIHVTAIFSIFLVILYIYIYRHVVYMDAAVPWQISFQDPGSPIMEGIIELHNQIFFVLIIILCIVSWLFGRVLWLFNNQNNHWTFKLPNSTSIEIIWTVIPIIILILIGLPSIKLLYAQDELIDPTITIKAIGHQWYWSYEYSDYSLTDNDLVTYDSYMIQEDSLKKGELRLLEADNEVIVPVGTNVRILVTAADVLHSWAVPSLGIKIDGVPGRLNQTPLFIKRRGLYYGQCSEICGENHGFMPIVVYAITFTRYLKEINRFMQEE